MSYGAGDGSGNGSGVGGPGIIARNTNPVDPAAQGSTKGKSAAGAPNNSQLGGNMPMAGQDTAHQGAANPASPDHDFWSQISANWGGGHNGANAPNIGNVSGNKSLQDESSKSTEQQKIDAYKAASAQNDRSLHPDISSPYGTQNWKQNPDGSWVQAQGFGGKLGWANDRLQSQADAAFSKPLGDGADARDQAITAAYNQSASRLNPQWAQRQQTFASGLANQGLDPNSEAYRNAQQDFGNQRNDAYTSAMSSAIGQGTAAQTATFNQNLAARNAPLSEMQAMLGLLPSNPGVNSQSLQAQQGADANNIAQQQVYADYVRGAGEFADGISKSDRRVKQNVQPIGMDAMPGVPLNLFEYKAAPGKRYVGVMAQDLEKVAPEHVAEDADGVKHVSPMFAPFAFPKKR